MTVILVVAMIIVFMAIDVIYQKATKRQLVVESKPVIAPAISRYAEVAVPQSLFFGKGHTWLNLRKSGNVQIGVDDFITKSIGAIDRIAFKAIGQEVKKGEALFTIEKGGKKLAFASPVSGVVEGLNDTLLSNLSSLKNNAYDNNWLCAVKPKSLASELKLMKVADEAANWIREEMTRLKDFIAQVNVENSLVGATMHDGGAPVNGFMEYLDNKTWEKFQNEFLLEK